MPYPLRVLRVEPGQRLTVRILSEIPDKILRGLLTHWYSGRSTYCTGQDCPQAVHRAPTLWKGYMLIDVFSATPPSYFPHVLEVSEALERDLRGVVARGQAWEIGRETPRKKGRTPVTGKLVKEKSAHLVPGFVDFLPVLRQLYHVEHVELSIVNPHAERVLVEAMPVEVPITPAKRDNSEIQAPRMAQDRFGRQPAAKGTAENGRKE